MSPKVGLVVSFLLLLFGSQGCTRMGSTEGPERNASPGVDSTPTEASFCGDLPPDRDAVQARYYPQAKVAVESPLRRIDLPRLLSAASALAGARSVIDAPPGSVRLAAFWGAPGSVEPSTSTAIHFLAEDGGWRRLTAADLGVSVGYLSAAGSSISPDGSRWLVDTSDGVTIVDFTTGDFDVVRESATGISHAWAPDSRHFALFDSRAKEVRIFDPQGKEQRLLAVPDWVGSVTLVSPSRLALVGVTGRSIRVQFMNASTREFEGSRECVMPGGAFMGLEDAKLETVSGKEIFLSALTNQRKQLYRYALLRLGPMQARMVFDVAVKGNVPYFENWLPGSTVILSGNVGCPNAIFGLNGAQRQIASLSQIDCLDGSGYENNPSMVFAPTVILRGD